MPLYDAKCPSCSAVVEILRSYERRDDPETCACGAAMVRTFMPPNVMRDIAGYESPIDGKWIGTRSQHRDHMKRHGVIELGNEKPVLKPFTPQIPRDSIRAELKSNLERMKAHGNWRER
jgi:hypothetical protein